MAAYLGREVPRGLDGLATVAFFCGAMIGGFSGMIWWKIRGGARD